MCNLQKSTRATIINIVIIALVLCLSNCTGPKDTPVVPDEIFLESILSYPSRVSIVKIDSLINRGDHSNHHKGLLYHERGRLLATLDRDIEAIGSLKNALHIFKSESDTSYLARTNMLLGDSYALLSKPDTAAFYTRTAYLLFKKIGDNAGESKTLNSLGHLEFIKENYIESAKLVKKAIDLQIELDDQDALSASYNNLGFILEQNEDYEQAIFFYKKAVTINSKIEKLNSSALRNLGYVYLIQNDIEKCKLLYNEALIIEEQTEQYTIQKEIYDVLIQASLKDEDLISIPILIRKKDSISQLLVTYENDQKTKLINTRHEQFIAQENLKKELALNEKSKLNYLTILGLLLALGLYIFQKNRNSRLLLKQEKIELEQKMLRLQMNPHFIFNTLTAIQNKVFDNKPLEQMADISRFAKLIRQNFEFVNQKEITLAEDIDALINYIETQQFRYNNSFKYELNVSQEIDVDFITIPPMLLQIFAENAIEHGLKPKIEDKEGSLIINISRQDDLIKFEIIDNGIGYIKKETKKEHAIDVFKKRLVLRKLGEERWFTINSLGKFVGTKVVFLLKLT